MNPVLLIMASMIGTTVFPALPLDDQELMLLPYHRGCDPYTHEDNDICVKVIFLGSISQPQIV